MNRDSLFFFAGGMMSEQALCLLRSAQKAQRLLGHHAASKEEERISVHEHAKTSIHNWLDRYLYTHTLGNVGACGETC